MNPSVLLAAFFATAIEVIEMVAIVVGVGVARSWRASLVGASAGLVVLAVLVAALGTAVRNVPLTPVRLIVGALLLVFGLQWLRKGVLRVAHDGWGVGHTAPDFDYEMRPTELRATPAYDEEAGRTADRARRPGGVAAAAGRIAGGPPSRPSAGHPAPKAVAGANRGGSASWANNGAARSASPARPAAGAVASRDRKGSSSVRSHRPAPKRAAPPRRVKPGKPVAKRAGHAVKPAPARQRREASGR